MARFQPGSWEGFLMVRVRAGAEVGSFPSACIFCKLKIWSKVNFSKQKIPRSAEESWRR